MAVETEIKFPCSGFKSVTRLLRSSGARTEAPVFERNLVLDTADGRLRSRDMLLRLRCGNTSELCLKLPSEEEGFDTVKVREETETEVGDFDAMREILLGLGFEEAFRYEKVREEWRLVGCTVCLDLLPFGTYVEIEGQRESLIRCAHTLGLDVGSGTASTYHELNLEHRRVAGQPLQDSFVFGDPYDALREHGRAKDRD
jgi:adenylate cyclase class 2